MFSLDVGDNARTPFMEGTGPGSGEAVVRVSARPPPDAPRPSACGGYPRKRMKSPDPRYGSVESVGRRRVVTERETV